MHLKHNARRWPLPATLLAVALATGGLAGMAGEPIRFSGRTGLAAKQEFDRREPLLPDEARANGKSGLRPELAIEAFALPSQAVTPTTGLTRRQREAQDQRQNWLLQSPESVLRQAEGREDPDRNDRSRNGRSQSAADRFLETPEERADQRDQQKSESSSDRYRRDRNSSQRAQDPARETRDPQGNELKSQPGEGKHGLETRQQGTSPGFESSGVFGAGDARGGTFGRVLNEARERERQRENTASLDAFRRSFNNPWAQSPTTSAGNPLGTSPSGLPAPGGLPGSDLQHRNAAANLGLSTRGPASLGTLRSQESFDPKNPLNYGATDSMLQPSSAARPAPAPIKLEAPRRKF